MNSLKALGLPEFKDWPARFGAFGGAPELFFNDQPMQIARWPNEGYAKFDKIIDEIEPGNLRLPVLMKKYVKQNARLVAFINCRFIDVDDNHRELPPPQFPGQAPP